MFTTGNAARDTTLRTVKYYQPLDTDTSYLADWGGQLTALGVDYLDAMLESGHSAGFEIGWDKYGRIQLGARATYAWTPALSIVRRLERSLDSIRDSEERDPAAQRPASSRSSRARRRTAKSNYIGNEIFAGLTWRFAPGLALDSAGGYMWTGPALDAFTNPTQGPREARNAYILTSRIRFSF